MQFSIWMGQVNKSSYFASANDVLMTTNTKLDSHLRFSEHITKIVRKAHQRANLIHRCFTCKDCDMLVKAFKVYVRPILEYSSPVWSPSFVKDILLIQSVQRKFTKRIPGMSGLTYHSRLTRLGLASLEVTRLRADILLVYKILFGMVQVNSNEFFTLRNQPHLRGHKYVINNHRSFNTRRVNYFSNRIVNLWNNKYHIFYQFTHVR